MLTTAEQQGRPTKCVLASKLEDARGKRDNHLRSEHFLDDDKYPTIVFKATGGRPVGAGLVELSGVLTVHGETQPMTLQAEVSGSGSSATVSTEVEIDRSLWGVSWAKMGTPHTRRSAPAM